MFERARIPPRPTLVVAAVTALVMLHPSSAGAATARTTRVSVSGNGAEGNDRSTSIDGLGISATGRFVVFYSEANNLAPGSRHRTSDVFVHDRQRHVTTEIGVTPSGRPGDSQSYGQAISANGRYVAFASLSSDLVANDTNHDQDVFVRDLWTDRTTLVSVSSTGRQGDDFSYFPSISADGRLVAFESPAANLVPGDTNGAMDVFVRDRHARTTIRVDVSSTGGQTHRFRDSGVPAISADGRFVAFQSASPNLVPGDTNHTPDVFVRDLMLGTTTRVSVPDAGGQATRQSFSPSITEDGRYVAFTSASPNLVPGDTNGTRDVFVRDLVEHRTIRVSLSSTGAQVHVACEGSAISADGRAVAFVSASAALVPGDGNHVADAFVRNLASDTTIRVSVSTDGAEGDGESFAPVLSADGAFVAFGSVADNLVPDDLNMVPDVFVRGPIA